LQIKGWDEHFFQYETRLLIVDDGKEGFIEVARQLFLVEGFYFWRESKDRES